MWKGKGGGGSDITDRYGVLMFHFPARCYQSPVAAGNRCVLVRATTERSHNFEGKRNIEDRSYKNVLFAFCYADYY